MITTVHRGIHRPLPDGSNAPEIHLHLFEPSLHHGSVDFRPQAGSEHVHDWFRFAAFQQLAEVRLQLVSGCCFAFGPGQDTGCGHDK